MAHTEANRKAFYADLEAQAEAKKKEAWNGRIQHWLGENPEIGELNKGNGEIEYYIMNDGTAQTINALQIIGGIH